MNGNEYILSNKLAAIRVKPQSKIPYDNAWQRTTNTDIDLSIFGSADNIGIVLGDNSGGIVDVDLDSEWARLAGPHLLPETGMIFGRASAPKSHHIYRVDQPGRSEKRKVRGKTSVEYRATGAMTVFPPSIHPTGERIEWHSHGNIATATREELLRRISMIAIIDEIASHYGTGSRHDFVLHFTGTLIDFGTLSDDEILELVYVLATVTNDDELDDRMRAVETTLEKARNGEPFTRGPQFELVVGGTVLNNIRKLLSAPTQSTPLVPVPLNGVSVDGPILLEPDRNDTGIAIEFARAMKDHIAYVDGPNIYYVYQDGLWSPDSKDARASKIFGIFIQHRCNLICQAGLDNRTVASELKFLNRYLSAGGIASGLKLARPHLMVPIDKFDAYDDVFAVGNGVVDLRTGILRENRPDDYVTRRGNVGYDPMAVCPTFKKFLKSIFPVTSDVPDFLQVILGYCLTGRTDRQEFYILYGQGSNGKSTLTGIISKILGSYSGILLPDSLFDVGNNRTADLSTMAGKRLGVASEAESQHKLASSQLKQLTGERTIKVRSLWQNSHEMDVKFKVVIACNKTPEFDGNDSAMKRRIVVVPFDVVIHPDQRDPLLLDKLWDERTGILAFLVAGAQRYYRGDYRHDKPADVVSATQDYFGEFDTLGPFLDACIEKTPGQRLTYKETFEAFEAFCHDNGKEACSKREFSVAMKNKGYRTLRGTGGISEYRDIQLKEDGSGTMGIPSLD